MCKITLKKLEPKPCLQDHKVPTSTVAVAVQNALPADFGDLELLLGGKASSSSLYIEEPFLSMNGTPLFTPVALNLESDGFPFPMPGLVPAPAPYAALISPVASADSFDFKFIPEAQYEEISEHYHTSDDAEDYSTPTSPESSSGSDNQEERCLKLSSPALVVPQINGIKPSQLTRLSSPSTPSTPRSCKRKSLHNPQISDEKRERNRLAAEKYRKKGRDLIVSLERKCEDLSNENATLFQRNKCLEDELCRLREILMKKGAH